MCQNDNNSLTDSELLRRLGKMGVNVESLVSALNKADAEQKLNQAPENRPGRQRIAW